MLREERELWGLVQSAEAGITFNFKVCVVKLRVQLLVLFIKKPSSVFTMNINSICL